MKSRISIDVDKDNQPIIKVDYIHSEDVRDKLVKKFLETFGTMSSWTKSDFHPTFRDPLKKEDCQTMVLRPISPAEFPENIKSMTEAENLRQTFYEKEEETQARHSE